jgi:hypothetical protein
MAAEDNSIQFSQEYIIQRNEKKEKKRSNKKIRCNRVQLKMPTSPGFSTFNN